LIQSVHGGGSIAHDVELPLTVLKIYEPEEPEIMFRIVKLMLSAFGLAWWSADA
jgi:hypothetical protein